jgi:hypothetical protein
MGDHKIRKTDARPPDMPGDTDKCDMCYWNTPPTRVCIMVRKGLPCFKPRGHDEKVR